MLLKGCLLLVARLSVVALGAIGPVADLHVANMIIAPDGFNRSYVSLLACTIVVISERIIQRCSCWSFARLAHHARTFDHERQGAQPSVIVAFSSLKATPLGWDILAERH